MFATVYDTKNGQDEVNCPPNCDSDDFHCSISEKCIKRRHVCDGTDDCEESEDEADCVSKGVIENEKKASGITNNNSTKITSSCVEFQLAAG